MALLTPKDIREHTFQTVRFKEGYDVDEVDDFLDQVTETVEALGRQAVAGGQATQSLGPDVSNLNAKISELSGQVQKLQAENADLKNAAAQAQPGAESDAQAAELAAAKLSEAEESNRALSAQNDQLKGQVDQLNAQIDQLTAQAAQATGNQKAVGQQIAAIQQERDQFRASNEELSRKLAEAQQQGAAVEQQAAQIADLTRQLEEAKQRENQLRSQVSKVEPSTETGSLQKIAGAASMPGTEPERATAMLTLAMQLHDQYVEKGKTKAQEITEASQNKYNELVNKANSYSDRTRSEADAYLTVRAPRRMHTPTRPVLMPTPTRRTRIRMPTPIQPRLVRTRITTPRPSTLMPISMSPKFRTVLPSTTRTLVLPLTPTHSRCATTYRLSPRWSRATSRASSSSRPNTVHALPSSSASLPLRFPNRTTTRARPSLSLRPTERR